MVSHCRERQENELWGRVRMGEGRIIISHSRAEGAALLGEMYKSKPAKEGPWVPWVPWVKSLWIQLWSRLQEKDQPRSSVNRQDPGARQHKRQLVEGVI